MASITLTGLLPDYGSGTKVGAYPQSSWPMAALPPSGAPLGSATATATVNSAGVATFTGLADNTDYFIVQTSGGTRRYTRTRTGPGAVDASSLAGTLAARPSAAVGQGVAYFATDDAGGTMYISDGSSWSIAGQRAITLAKTRVTTDRSAMAAGLADITDVVLPEFASRGRQFKVILELPRVEIGANVTTFIPMVTDMSDTAIASAEFVAASGTLNRDSRSIHLESDGISSAGGTLHRYKGRILNLGGTVTPKAPNQGIVIRAEET